MNKKDVLGASAAAGNVQKMKSAPLPCPVLEMIKKRHSTGQGQGGILARLCYLIQVKTKTKKF